MGCLFLQLDIKEGFPSPIPRCYYCSRRRLYSPLPSRSANCGLSSSGLPPQKNGNRLSPRTQGFHQPAEIKICISVSRHVQTATGDDVSALGRCTASSACREGEGDRRELLDTKALIWKERFPQSSVHIAAFLKHICARAHTPLLFSDLHVYIGIFCDLKRRCRDTLHFLLLRVRNGTIIYSFHRSIFKADL